MTAQRARRRRSPVTVAVVVVVAVSTGLLATVLNDHSASASWYVRGPVRIWLVPYRAHNGKWRRIYLDLPRSYGPKRHPSLPLVISPHGRQSTARHNSSLWGPLPALDRFAVANPEGEGRTLGNESWGDPGQIADLARIPTLLHRKLPWLHIDRRRIYAVGGSMGGQEALLLLAHDPRLLAGVVAFDAPTNLAARYYALARLRNGPYLQRLMRREVGGTPQTASAQYQQRSPLDHARKIAFAGVPIELWWSRHDGVVVDQASQSGLLYQHIETLNPTAPIHQVIGNWPHMAEMNWQTDLPRALRWLGLFPTRSGRRRGDRPARAGDADE